MANRITKTNKKQLKYNKNGGGIIESAFLLRVFGKLLTIIAAKSKKYVAKQLSQAFLQTISQGVFDNVTEKKLYGVCVARQKLLYYIFVDYLKKEGFEKLLNPNLPYREKVASIYELLKDKLKKIIMLVAHDERLNSKEFNEEFLKETQKVMSTGKKKSNRNSLPERLRSSFKERIPAPLRNMYEEQKVAKMKKNYTKKEKKKKERKKERLLHDKFESMTKVLQKPKGNLGKTQRDLTINSYGELPQGLKELSKKVTELPEGLSEELSQRSTELSERLSQGSTGLSERLSQRSTAGLSKKVIGLPGELSEELTRLSREHVSGKEADGRALVDAPNAVLRPSRELTRLSEGLPEELKRLSEARGPRRQNQRRVSRRSLNQRVREIPRGLTGSSEARGPRRQNLKRVSRGSQNQIVREIPRELTRFPKELSGY